VGLCRGFSASEPKLMLGMMDIRKKNIVLALIIGAIAMLLYIASMIKMIFLSSGSP
jgi:hypothetical protein